MNLFCTKDEEKEHLAQIYFSMEVFLIGSIFYANKASWFVFKEHFKECLSVFLSLNIIDDDQIFLLWAFRNYPKNYNILRTYEWFDSLFYFIPKHLREKISVKTSFTYHHKELKEKLKFAIQEKKILQSLKFAFLYFFFKIYKKKSKRDNKILLSKI